MKEPSSRYKFLLYFYANVGHITCSTNAKKFFKICMVELFSNKGQKRSDAKCKDCPKQICDLVTSVLHLIQLLYRSVQGSGVL